MLFNGNSLRAHEFPLQRGLAVLEEHLDHFAKVPLQFIQGLAL